MKINTIGREFLKNKEEMGKKGNVKCILPKPSSAVIDTIKSASEIGKVKSYEDGYSKGKNDWTVMIPQLWIIEENGVSPDELLKAFKLDPKVNFDPEDDHNVDITRIPRFILKKETSENKKILVLIYEIREKGVTPETYLAEI